MDLQIITGARHAPLEPLSERTVAVIGYGNQGHAHALNLRDSEVTTIVGTRRGGPGDARARADGFQPLEIAEAVSRADLVVLAVPDELQPRLWTEQIAPHLPDGAVAGFLHGFAIHYRLIRPDPGIGVIMVAPKGPGTTLRRRFRDGLGIPCLLAVHQASPTADARSLALAWANGIGCARAGIICTTFAQETETDLFGEQAVLCGGMTGLVLAAFETLVEAGYPPELAYLECCHEVKQVADLVYERGLAGMMNAISNTAEFGAHEAAPRLVDERVRAVMAGMLEAIRDGSFARRMMADADGGFPWFKEQRRKLESHGIEAAGEVIRRLMEGDGTKHKEESTKKKAQSIKAESKEAREQE